MRSLWLTRSATVLLSEEAVVQIRRHLQRGWAPELTVHGVSNWAFGGVGSVRFGTVRHVLSNAEFPRTVDRERLARETVGPLEAELVHERLAALSRALAQRAARRQRLLEHRAHRRIHGAQKEL